MLLFVFHKLAYLYELVISKRTFIPMLDKYNKAGFHSLLHPLHVSLTKQQRLHQISKCQLCLCPLEHQVYTDVINLDQYNISTFLIHVDDIGLMHCTIFSCSGLHGRYQRCLHATSEEASRPSRSSFRL